MAGLFDRLQNELDDRDKEGGITALDLADLPAPLRKLMRLMLRKIELDTPSLRQAVDAMPEKDRMEKAELDQALDELCKKSWLIRRGEGDSVSYKVNLRRKASSTLMDSIWSSLDDKIEGQEDTSAQDEDQ
jgi:hypothetical protein